MGQKKYGEKWTAAVDLQPTIPKSDRLLGPCTRASGVWIVSVERCWRTMSFSPGSQPPANSNGLKSSTPKSEKSATLRVTTFS